MPYAEDDDLSTLIIDPVEDAVGAAPRTPDTLELVAKRRAHPLRILPERTSDEVDDGKRDRFGERLPDGPCRRGGYDDLIERFGHLGRRAFTASTPRTTSPSR